MATAQAGARVIGPRVVIGPCPLYTYRLRVQRVINGHSIQGKIQLGFGIDLWAELRLLGICCPLTDNPAGLAAREHLLELIGDAERVGQLWVRTHLDQGTIERMPYLATLFARGVNLNVQMLRDGYAVEYWPRQLHVDDKTPG